VENTIGVENMPREEWYIHYSSNIRKEATKDAAAMRGLHEAERDVSANRVISKKQLTDEFKRKVKDRTITGQLTKKVTNWSKALQKNTIIQRALAKSSHTAGINVGMLSLRISEGLVPVLLLAYSAILPVVAGLLAIASASVVAAAGVAGVLGLGVAALSTQRGAPPVWGARNVTQDKDVFAELLEPLKDTLKSRELRSTIKIVTELTEDFFGDTLPNTFKEFVKTVDIGAISDLFKSFQDFLPRAAKSVAELGNEIYNAIGKRSLDSINKLFKYIADGLRNTAFWLSQSGFDDLESFGSILSRFLSQLVSLGKEVLPTLTKALESIYPIPLAPIISLLTDFFNQIRDTKIQKGITDLASIGITLITLSTALGVVGGIIGSLEAFSFIGFALGVAEGATLLAGLTGAGFLVGIYLLTRALLSLAESSYIVRKVLTNLGVYIINTFIGVWNALTFSLRSVVNLIGTIIGNDRLRNFDPSIDYWRYGLREDNLDNAAMAIGTGASSTTTQPIELTIYNETNLDSDVIDTSFTRKFFEPVVPTNNSGRFSLIGGN
jgi:hypothetical protein